MSKEARKKSDAKAKHSRPRKDAIKVGSWTIEQSLAWGYIEGTGPAEECDGSCCACGVHTSMGEKERILEYADNIKAAMDRSQTTDTSRWFDREVKEDPDFPGGLAAMTSTHNEKCVFLNGRGRCVLQAAEESLDLPDGEHLKPWYCFLFPVTNALDSVDFDPIFDGKRPCCTHSTNGGTRAVEAFEFELRMLLGEKGYCQLKDRACDREDTEASDKKHKRSR